jgi:hypothetical protein
MCALGAIVFSMGSYNFVILEAGHYTKARCIGLLPVILGGIMMLFQRKYLAGAAITAFFLYFQIKSNHPQITYYMFLMLGFYFLYQLIEAVRNKQIKNLIISVSIFVGSIVLAVAANYTQLWVTYEYTKDTMRGGSELAEFSKSGTKNTKGLDQGYAFNWSYGKLETLTILIPDLFGGASNDKLKDDSKVYEALTSQGVPSDQAEGFARQLPVYWGPKVQASASATTSGPVYIGAIICFLFLLGIFVIKDNYRWWIFGSSILAVMMAWGKFLLPFNSFLFEHLPMYNKFRTVEMSMVVLEITLPLFAMLTLKKIVDGDVKKDNLLKALKYSTIGIGVLLLVFAIMPSLVLSFDGKNMDESLKANLQNYGQPFVEKIMNALKMDRETIAKNDAWRSLIFVLIAAASIWAYVTDKIKSMIMVAIIGVASLIDLWSLDKRYLNDDNFREDEASANYAETEADVQILQDKTLSYRIFNYNNPFNDAIPSYHHKNIGGYNPAKLSRYQDLIDSCISRGNQNVVNMLNAKYFIGKAQNGKDIAQLNPAAMGNAWFVDSLKVVNNAQQEIVAMKTLNPKSSAVIDASKFKENTTQLIFSNDSTANISLTKNDLDELTYESKTSKPQLAVFSEVYYADKNHKGWQAYLDGKPVEHFRVNYILRAMVVPAGNHKIEFKFEPKPFFEGQKISFIGSILMIILLLCAIVMEVLKLKKIAPKVVQK